ncbi:hypothetical protein ACWG8W_06495 [Citricoccus zhacaiensis]
MGGLIELLRPLGDLLLIEAVSVGLLLVFLIAGIAAGQSHKRLIMLADIVVIVGILALHAFHLAGNWPEYVVVGAVVMLAVEAFRLARHLLGG